MEQKKTIVNKSDLRKDAAGNFVLPEKNEFKMTPEMYMQAHAICPLDGRYQRVWQELESYVSDFALTKNRVCIELEWLIMLVQNLKESEILRTFDADDIWLRTWDIYDNFDEEDYFRIKEIERITNHDVKAVELFVAENLEALGLEKLASFVHFGCTSEDITNIAYAMMIGDVLDGVWIPKAERFVSHLGKMAEEHADTAMPAHTHGQKASPTTFGKEILVLAYRLKKAIQRIKDDRNMISAKCNGATGNYAAVTVAFPNVKWEKLEKQWLGNGSSMQRNPVTTQIEGHDYMCHILDDIRHFNNVLMDFNWDMWSYISRDYLKLRLVASEVGSSTMPQKVNPIHFENSISNADTSNALCMGLSNKLPISHMQRDLTDSSSKRNLGMAFGYSVQAIESAMTGLKRIDVNTAKMEEELESEWSVLGEAVQTMLRKYGVTDAYEQLKQFTRGKHITKEIMHDFISSLEILPEEEKQRLLSLTPATYTGLAEKIVKKYSKEVE